MKAVALLSTLLLVGTEYKGVDAVGGQRELWETIFSPGLSIEKVLGHTLALRHDGFSSMLGVFS